MDYFSIKQALEDIIGEYIQVFLIDLGDFCEWAKKYLERENSK